MGEEVGSPDMVVAALCAGFVAWCLVSSWVTGTYSHVDRLWSITPAVYAVVYAALSGGDRRCILMAVLACAWGARLTHNFARKGGYGKGEQDYRWPVLQKLPLLAHPVTWQLFNLSFIATYQNVLLLLIVLPSAVAWQQRGAALNALDGLAAVAMTAFLAVEATADQQQWIFQQSKHRAPGFVRQRHLQDDYSRGFLTHGLFRFSRHPNFFAEQCVWVSYYIFAVASLWNGSDLSALGAWRVWAHPSAAGAVLLVLLFQGSTTFTESITRGKYPEYREYQKVTSRLLPLPPFGAVRIPTKKSR